MRVKLLVDLELEIPYTPDMNDLDSWIIEFARWIKDASDEYPIPDLMHTETFITDVDIEMLD